MAAALPVTKLATLLVKTLAKPLSKRIKHDFSRYDFTSRLLRGVGQASHQVTSRMTIWSSGYRVRRITPLEEEKALTNGADFVGEAFILLVSGTTVVWEYNRSKEKDRVKEEKRQRKFNDLDARVQALETAAEKEQSEQEEASLSGRILGSRQPKKCQAPNPDEIVPIDDHSSKEAAGEEVSSVDAKEATPYSKEETSSLSDSSSWWSWRPW